MGTPTNKDHGYNKNKYWEGEIESEKVICSIPIASW
jgi:hypothetical protein